MSTVRVAAGDVLRGKYRIKRVLASVGAHFLVDGVALKPGKPVAVARLGSTAVVVLSAEVHPPIVNFLIPDGIRIEAKSTARSRLTR